MQLPDYIYEHLDVISALSSIVAALICPYLSQVILRERTPMVQLQRLSLAVLGVSLFANGVLSFPDWAMVNGHRPTGALVNLAVMVNMAVMAIRGHIMYQPSRNEHHAERPN